MARGALVRLQARDGYHTSDNEPSLACHASASITGCVRKSLLRLRPSACLTRDHRLGAACRGSEAGEPTGAREQVCGSGVILTASVKGAREGARVKIMPVGRPQTAGRYPPNEVSREAVTRGVRAGRAQASPSGGAAKLAVERSWRWSEGPSERIRRIRRGSARRGLRTPPF